MIVPICLLFVVFSVGTHAEDMDIDVPTNVANRSMAVKGQFFCGNNKPYAGATVRLFRVFQANAADDLAQLMDAKDSQTNGEFLIEGNTLKFPKTQTEVDPFLTVHHACGISEKDKTNKGHKRWQIRIPADYVTRGRIPRKTYDIGKVNLLVEYPGETFNKMQSV